MQATWRRLGQGLNTHIYPAFRLMTRYAEVLQPVFGTKFYSKSRMQRDQMGKRYLRIAGGYNAGHVPTALYLHQMTKPFLHVDQNNTLTTTKQQNITKIASFMFNRSERRQLIRQQQQQPDHILDLGPGGYNRETHPVIFVGHANFKWQKPWSSVPTKVVFLKFFI